MATHDLSGLYTPPPSSSDASKSPDYEPRKRRRRTKVNSAGDETSDFFAGPELTELGYTAEKKRVGCPPLIELPLQTIPVDASVQLQLTPLIPELQECLRVYNVEVQDLAFVHRVVDLSTFSREHCPPCVFISASHRSNYDNLWLKAIKEIRHLLNRARAAKAISIEIMDPSLQQAIYLGVIEPQNWFIDVWSNELRAQCLGILSTNMPHKWHALDVLRIGANEDGQQNMITISVSCHEDVQEREWSKSQKMFEEVLSQARLPENIAVAFDRHPPIATAGVSLDPPPILESHSEEIIRGDYSSKCGLGAEFGAAVDMKTEQNERLHGSTCSLGGWLLVEYKNGKKSRMGLTNYHCVRYGMAGHVYEEKGVERPPAEGSGLRIADRFGFTQAQSAKFQIPLLESPSRRRHRITVSNEQAIVNRFPAQSMIKTQLQKRIGWWEKNRILGTPVLASGLARRTENNGRLDWALIQAMNEDRIAPNRIPGVDVWALKMYAGLIPTAANDATSVNGIASVHSAKAGKQIVYMVGARSGVVAGRFSEIKSEIKFGWDNWLDGVSPSEEYIFVHEQGQQETTQFGMPGDSGSIVFRGDGKWLGLFFAGASASKSATGQGYGYFQDAAAVVADIISYSKEVDAKNPIVNVQLA